MVNVAKKTVGGIAAELVKEQVVDEALSRLDIVPSAEKSTLEGKVEILKEYFGTLPNNKLADCDICGAASDFELPSCPFCGHGDEQAASPSDLPPADEIDEGDSQERSDEVDPLEAGEMERNSSSAPEDAGIAIDPAALPAEISNAPPAPLVNRKAARKSKAKEETAPKTALALVKPAAVEKLAKPLEGVAALDAAVRDILTLDRGFGASAWMLASKVSELAKGQLWKLRLDTKGKVKFRTFEEFANDELGMTRHYARDLQKIFLRFTKDEFEKVGPTKLRLVLVAPEGDQEALLEKVKKNEGVKVGELAAEVKEKRKKAGLKSAGTKKKRAPKEDGRITVASVLGKAAMAVSRKPEKKGEDPEPVVLKPNVAALLNGAYTYFDMGNDTRCWLYLKTKPNGQLVIQRDVRRVTE